MDMELITEFLIFCAEFYLLYAIIYVIMSYIEQRIITRIDYAESIVKYINSLVHEVKVEQRDGMIYWYDAEDNRFIAQGRSREEIIEVLKLQFPDHVFLIDEKEVLTGPEFVAVPLADVGKIKLGGRRV